MRSAGTAVGSSICKQAFPCPLAYEYTRAVRSFGHADDGGVVLRPVDSLDVPGVLVNAVVLRAVDAPDDDVGVRAAADNELCCSDTS